MRAAKSGEGRADRRSWVLLPGQELVTTYRGAWEQLNGDYNRSHPLLDPKFVVPAYDHFGTESVRLAVLRRHEVPVGLALVEKVGLARWQLFTPSQAPLGLAVMPRGCLTNVPEIFHALGRWSGQLGWLSQDPLFSAFDETPVGPEFETLPHALTTRVAVRGTFEDYWNSRSTGLRASLRKITRRLRSAELDTRLDVLREPSVMKDAVSVHGELETASWKGLHGTAIHEANKQGHFYTAVLENYARERGARVFQLWLGASIAASLLTISQNGMLVVLKIAHDESLREFAPGRYLDYLAAQSVFSDKDFELIENYTNASPEDARWATDTRMLFHVNCYRSPIMRRLARVYRRLRGLATPGRPDGMARESEGRVLA